MLLSAAPPGKRIITSGHAYAPPTAGGTQAACILSCLGLSSWTHVHQLQASDDSCNSSERLQMLNFNRLCLTARSTQQHSYLRKEVLFCKVSSRALRSGQHRQIFKHYICMVTERDLKPRAPESFVQQLLGRELHLCTICRLVEVFVHLCFAYTCSVYCIHLQREARQIPNTYIKGIFLPQKKKPTVFTAVSSPSTGHHCAFYVQQHLKVSLCNQSGCISGHTV